VTVGRSAVTVVQGGEEVWFQIHGCLLMNTEYSCPGGNKEHVLQFSIPVPSAIPNVL